MVGRILLVLVFASVGIRSTAFAGAHHMNEWEREREKEREEKEAKKGKEVIEKLPNSIELKVGQVRKYSGVQACFFSKPGIIRTMIMHDVLTITALKSGRVALIPESGAFGTGGPKGKYINVTVSD